MNKVYILLLILFSSCIVAPEFERTSEYDLKGGVPYIRNFQINFNATGIFIGWIDGSLDNSEYILTQKLYSGTDSLIKEVVLPGDAKTYFDTSKKYGVPYNVILTSNILNKDGSIKDQRKDTVSLGFGNIAISLTTQKDGFLETKVQISQFNPAIKSIIFDVDKGQGWERYSTVLPNQNLFKYPIDEIEQLQAMRFAIVINDFNDEELIVDSKVRYGPF